jgi:hypothetical protein
VSTALIDNISAPTSSLGLEPTGRAATLLLLDKLNDQIAVEEERWRAADREFQTLTGISLGETELELFDPSSFHEGPHESLLKAPPSKLPAVNVMAFTVQPDTEQLDQIDCAALRLYVETLVKAGPVEDEQEIVNETIVHRRIQRTTEAVNRVILTNSTLLGVVRPIQSLPRGGIGQSAWLRREEKGHGPRYLWQGSRLEYALQRHSDF